MIVFPTEARELAEAVILDHDARPRNFGEVPSPTHVAQAYSPLCGDRYTVSVRVFAGVIEDVQFDGFGCAVSKSSASIMTEQVKGLPVTAARHRFLQFARALGLEEDGDRQPGPELGELQHLLGVREFPTRAKCALLPWRGLMAALDGVGNVEVM